MPLPSLPRPRFSLNTIMLLTLGFAAGYGWNLWIWRLPAWPTEGNMTTFPSYVIEPPDVLRIGVTTAAPESASVLSGEHLVAMDGRISLGDFGSVYVAGMTLDEARQAITTKLASQVEKPKVVLDVLSYNSKIYFVIQQGSGLGDDVIRLPITGSETVLDAIAAIGGLRAPDTTEIWIDRPAPNGVGPPTQIPVDWKAVSTANPPSANYQLYPGDRLFIAPKQQTGSKPAPALTLQPAAVPPPAPRAMLNYLPHAKASEASSRQVIIEGETQLPFTAKPGSRSRPWGAPR
jgi:protein involved in polysaccharide export with SLBB domain